MKGFQRTPRLPEAAMRLGGQTPCQCFPEHHWAAVAKDLENEGVGERGVQWLACLAGQSHVLLQPGGIPERADTRLPVTHLQATMSDGKNLTYDLSLDVEALSLTRPRGNLGVSKC